MRVDRAFAFVDLCGFTAFAEREGDETAVLVLAELRTMMREAAARRGVRVVKWLGDGAMLSSTMPDAVAALTVEVDRRMRRSVPSLALRAGMDNGPVIMFEGDDYIGRPVNVASRLCDAAAAHEVLATAVVATTLPGWITARPGPRLRPAGFDVDLDVCRLEVADPAPAPTATDPACGLTLARSQMLGAPSGEWYCSEACAGTERATVPA